MKKMLLVILLVSAFYSDVYSQTIQVGMSTTEVKKVLGNPEIVQSGFPSFLNKSKSVISYPSFRDAEFVGQLNSSTWIYVGNIQKIITNVTYFYLDNEKVDEETYDAYETLLDHQREKQK